MDGDIWDIVARVEKLNFPIGQYVVFGSGVLAALGIRPARDIDVSVTPLLHKKLRASGEWSEEVHHGKIFLRKGEFEIMPELYWDAHPHSTQEIIKNATMIEGIPFMNLSDLKRFKRILSREKDKEDIVLIEKYETSRGLSI